MSQLLFSDEKQEINQEFFFMSDSKWNQAVNPLKSTRVGIATFIVLSIAILSQLELGRKIIEIRTSLLLYAVGRASIGRAETLICAIGPYDSFNDSRFDGYMSDSQRLQAERILEEFNRKAEFPQTVIVEIGKDTQSLFSSNRLRFERSSSHSCISPPAILRLINKPRTGIVILEKE